MSTSATCLTEVLSSLLVSDAHDLNCENTQWQQQLPLLC